MVNYTAAAEAAARRWCGWVVTPPEENVEVTLDGGGAVLSLPSLYVTELVSVVEDGTTLDLDDVRLYGSLGQVRKRSGGCWGCEIVVTFTHGYDSAPDFDAAVAQAAAALEASGTRSDSAVKRVKVDDVETEWFESAASFLNVSLLSPYRILPQP